MIRLYNTLTRKIEDFKPIRKGRVGLYTCGPTVYNFAHIGNLRTYIFEDILRRTLEYSGYNVTHVMNITDVGHLTSDADAGEDKLEKGAKREGKTVWDIARFYTRAFLKDIRALNIKRAQNIVPATSAIREQIAVIKKLFAGGFAYETPEAVYFDVSKFRNYTKLSRQRLEEKKAGARAEVIEDPGKKHPQDFALWFKRVGKFKNHVMHWNSPWGDGFPGWHIECSAISTSRLGQPFDIHTGGVDHIAVHHTNEIAQSEGAFKKPLARFWMHGEFLLVADSKMAKSAGTFLTLQELEKKGFNPLAFRYLVLTSHYRSKLNFTWESLRAAEHSLERVRSFIKTLLSERKKPKHPVSLEKYRSQFDDALKSDLQTPQALSVLWKIISDYNTQSESFDAKKILALLYDFDQVLGLHFTAIKKDAIPETIRDMAMKREVARRNKDWDKADKFRAKIETAGFVIFDTPDGSKLRKKQ
ncbi:MAG: cysteine--tRNA ligase [Candidatus Sungbacteria bacterium RIFCSPHIGHO2_01_FULL_50_25]|uniref:Cysteine--tRNA ligase n=1 Tax=Candidatus Sungbacteria bacterium RIFCSPHIGHO2_01_FULL_50_25 TaxID=1802265 RepID=A0A1G2K7R9_9BACT|nr:MAG: cysteine--tRNA ligase [Candidatus Sungbacteria bacterium RIFCSPHIGHO2_01_FULL_50_25]